MWHSATYKKYFRSIPPIVCQQNFGGRVQNIDKLHQIAWNCMKQERKYEIRQNENSPTPYMFAVSSQINFICIS